VIFIDFLKFFFPPGLLSVGIDRNNLIQKSNLQNEQAIAAPIDDGEQQTFEATAGLVRGPPSLFHLLDLHRPGAHHVHRPHHLWIGTYRFQSAPTLRIGWFSHLIRLK
jgi:hypothetical protein